MIKPRLLSLAQCLFQHTTRFEEAITGTLFPSKSKVYNGALLYNRVYYEPFNFNCSGIQGLECFLGCLHQNVPALSWGSSGIQKNYPMLSQSQTSSTVSIPSHSYLVFKAESLIAALSTEEITQ